MFYNTTELKGKELSSAILKAKNQDDRIHTLLKQFKGYYTPFQIQAQYNRLFKEIPITSVRRSLNTLTKDGKCMKSELMVVERYGAKNHKWKAI